ncbi:MAG: STAS/SEC14 domain-containing protein [Bacteroidales bacterium]
MFKVLDITKNNLTAFKVQGKITKSDYDKLNALFEKNKREYVTQKLYIEIDTIESITAKALWEDFKTYFAHVKNFDKIAIIGESKLVKILTKLSKPFVSGDVKFFNTSEASKAKEWIMK